MLSNFSEDGQSVLKLMIQYDPESRINVRRLVEHRYFSTLRDQYLINQFRFAALQQTLGVDVLDSFAKCTGDHMMGYLSFAESLKHRKVMIIRCFVDVSSGRSFFRKITLEINFYSSFLEEFLNHV